MSTIKEKLSFVAELMRMPRLTTIDIGVAKILKVDEHTFTISDVDDNELIGVLPDELTNKIHLEVSSEDR